MTALRIGLAAALLIPATMIPTARGDDDDGRPFKAKNEAGVAWTINVGGFPVVDPDNPFFQDLGGNGRRCVTCHQPAHNMSISAAGVAERFEKTAGKDPLFRLVDGANSPLADVSTREARRAAYSMLLTKGLVRVGLPVPPDAEFTLGQVADPYGYAGHNDRGDELSLFRRPLPTTNLAFLSTVMWDGRETLRKGSAPAIHFDLAHQANSAAEGHAELPLPLSQPVREQMVAYQLGLYTAQVSDDGAGELVKDGAAGGPEQLATRAFVFGGNDPLGCDPEGVVCTGGNPHFDPVVFTDFDAWSGVEGSGRNRARLAIARGQALFNTLPIAIVGVSGINDDFDTPAVIGTCTTCHDTPHAGNHSVPAPLDIGVSEPPVPVADGGDGVLNRFGLPVGDMPVYVLCRVGTACDRPGETRKVVTDPGRALVTGKWRDIGRFKGPILRGLSGRAPYFHNGAAATLADVVRFYDARFELRLTEQQRADLVAFLRAL
jgi:hypothetical protein